MSKNELANQENNEMMTYNTTGLGLDDSDNDDSTLAYLKVVQALSKEVESLELPVGSIIHGTTKQVLAKKEQPFDFIPILSFRDWSIWEGVGQTSKLIKRTFDKHGTWSDGSECLPEEFEWKGRTKPLARECLNFVIIPAPISAGIPPAIMSFKSTDLKTGNAFKNVARGLSLSEKCPLFGFVFQTKTKGTTNQRGSWYIYDVVKKNRSTDEEERKFAFEIFKRIKEVGIQTLIPVGFTDDDDASVDIENSKY